jgi:uncharacterized protein YprB with RNaseH-like and TPR domain
MLQNTFLHIPGIGVKTEQRLWETGIISWNRCATIGGSGFSPKKMETMAKYLRESKHHMVSLNANYFADRLPASHHWRFFPEFRDVTVYLDIETTGLSHYGETITTIALYDGKSIFHYVNGRNLDDFPEDIQRCKVIVTYNGKNFDVPFIEKTFGIELNQAHIDLRYILAGLGYKGGLKSCENQLGFYRGDLADIDGFFAVLLWLDYRNNGNEKALETLLAYNIKDVLTLENLMVTAYNLKIKDTPFFSNFLPEPDLTNSPFRADMETVKRIRSRQNLFRFV